MGRAPCGAGRGSPCVRLEQWIYSQLQRIVGMLRETREHRGPIVQRFGHDERRHGRAVQAGARRVPERGALRRRRRSLLRHLRYQGAIRHVLRGGQLRRRDGRDDHHLHTPWLVQPPGHGRSGRWSPLPRSVLRSGPGQLRHYEGRLGSLEQSGRGGGRVEHGLVRRDGYIHEGRAVVLAHRLRPERFMQHQSLHRATHADEVKTRPRRVYSIALGRWTSRRVMSVRLTPPSLTSSVPRATRLRPLSTRLRLLAELPSAGYFPLPHTVFISAVTGPNWLT